MAHGAGAIAQAATLWGPNLVITLLSTIDEVGVGPTMRMYAGFNVLAIPFVRRYFPEPSRPPCARARWDPAGSPSQTRRRRQPPDPTRRPCDGEEDPHRRGPTAFGAAPAASGRGLRKEEAPGPPC